ncbi:GL15884 [Drosophila persimilis]|uniref:GL15884 n=1 Tax=Drosophila persimilis TaxID=7234 RepID=B4H0Y6_DROPE|nr:GL15884 [Drosophila persimilis]
MNRVASDSISRVTCNHGQELLFEQETRRLYWMARSVGYWLAARTTCTTTGAPGTLIKTEHSRSLAKERALHPPSYGRARIMPLQVCRERYPWPRTGLERITVRGERRSVELHRLSQFTDIRAVWTPDAKVLHNHTAQLPKLFPKLHSQRGVTRSTRDVCSCPKHLMLLADKENYGVYPARFKYSKERYFNAQ